MFSLDESDIKPAEDITRFKRYNARARRCTLPSLSASADQAWEIPKRTPLISSRRCSEFKASEFGSLADYEIDNCDNLDVQIAEEFRRKKTTSASCLNLGIGHALSRAGGSFGNLLKLQKGKTEGNRTYARKVSFQKVVGDRQTGLEAIIQEAMDGPLSLGDFTWKMKMKCIQDGVFCLEVPLGDLDDKDITLRINRGRLIFMSDCGFGEASFPIPRGFVNLPDFIDLNTLNFVLTHDKSTLVVRGMVKGIQVSRRLTDSVLPGLAKRVKRSWFKRFFPKRNKSIEVSVVRIGSFN